MKPSGCWLSVYICVPLQIILQIRKDPSYFFLYHLSQSKSKPGWLVLAPPSPAVQDAKGHLLLGMVSKNMDFQARLPYYKMSKQKSSRPVSVQRSTQRAESCGDLPSAIQTAGGQMRAFGTVTAKFRSGRKILHWTERLLSSPEIADVDLNGLSNKWQWGIQTCSSLRVKGGAWRSCLTTQKQQGAWRGPVHLVGCLANTITREPEKLIKTSVLD